MNQADASSATNIRPMIDNQGRVLVRIGVPAWEARRAYRIGDKVTPTSFNIAGAPYVFEAVQIGISTGLDGNGDAIYDKKTAPTEPNWASACPGATLVTTDGDTCPWGTTDPSLALYFCGILWKNTGVSVPVGVGSEAESRPDPPLRRRPRARRHEAHGHVVALRGDRRRQHGLQARGARARTGIRRSAAPRRSATTARRSPSSAISPIRRCAGSARRR